MMKNEEGDSKEQQAKQFLQSHEVQQKSFRRKKKASEALKNYAKLDNLVGSKFKKFKLKGHLS